jgi:hypothetical protein
MTVRDLKAYVIENVIVLREVIHDASAPMDDELRRRSRGLLVLLVSIPTAFIVFGYLVWELWVTA